MNDTDRAARALEAHEIHQAVCRYRRQGLVCSTCTELAECAYRLSERAGKEAA
jgi:hypothetical protein